MKISNKINKYKKSKITFLMFFFFFLINIFLVLFYQGKSGDARVIQIVAEIFYKITAFLFQIHQMVNARHIGEVIKALDILLY